MHKESYCIKYILIGLTSYLLLCLLPACNVSKTTKVQHFTSDAIPKNVGDPVLLNLNSYYFLYMHPFPPFKSEGRIFVPLDRFAVMLGIDHN